MKNIKIGHFRPKNSYKIRKIAIFLLFFGIFGIAGHFIYQSFAATVTVSCKYGSGTCDDSYKHWFGDGYVDGYIAAGANPRTSEYIVNYNGTNYAAMCAEAAYGNATDPGGTVSTNSNAMIKAVLLTAPGGPLYNSSLYTNMKSASGLAGNMSYNDDYGIAHSIVSLLYSDQTVGWSPAGRSRLSAAGSYLYSYVQSNYPDYLSSYSVMQLYRADTPTYFVQDLVFLVGSDPVTPDPPTPQTQFLTIIKVDSETDAPLAGAVFGIYTDENATNLLQTMPATGSDGKTTVTGLNVGWYYIKEISAPEGYELDPTIRTATIIEDHPDGGRTFTIKNTRLETKGAIVAMKYKVGTTETLAGATFGVYESNCTTKVSSIASKTTGSDGKVTFSDVPAGNYCVVEEIAPSGYDKANSQIVNITSGTTQTLNFYDSVTIINGKIRVRKKSSNESITSESSSYSLGGAEFYICKDSACNVKETTLTTTNDGYTAWYETEPGTYYVKEKTAPEGFNINTTIKTVVLANGGTQEIEMVNTPILGSITIKKKDAETGKSIAFEGGELDGAKFEIRNGANIKVEEVTIVDGEAEISNLPLGAYSIKEVSSGEGYTFDINSRGVVLSATSPDKIVDYPNSRVRGDIKLKKVDQDGKVMEGVQFKVVAIPNGVSEVKRLAEEKSLLIEEYVIELNKTLKNLGDWIDVSKAEERVITTNSDGIATTENDPEAWFGDMEYSEEADGNLPYGVYGIVEVAGEVNEGYYLSAPKVVFVSRNGYLVDLGEFINTKKPDDPVDPDEPKIIPDTGVFTGMDEFLKENVVIFTTFGVATGVGIVVLMMKNTVFRKKTGFRSGRRR